MTWTKLTDKWPEGRLILALIDEGDCLTVSSGYCFKRPIGNEKGIVLHNCDDQSVADWVTHWMPFDLPEGLK